MEERTPGAGIGAAVGMLAPLAAPLAAVGILRLFPPLDPASVGVAWLLPAGSAVAAAAVGVATLVSLSTAIGHGRPRDVLAAAALGLLTGCLAADALGAPALAAGSIVTAVALLGAALAAPMTVRLAGGRDRLLGAAAALVWVEAALAILLLLAPSLIGADAWRGPLLAVASGVVAAAAIASIGSGRPLGLAWLAIGLDALAFARPDSIEVLAGLAAVGAGTVCLALMDRPSPAARRPAADSLARDGLPELARDVGGPQELRLEADRLGRELRGTIEELLRSRRTIDLQRTELEQAATVDLLTGVASRPSIVERLRIEVAEARRYAHPVAIALVDIDGFGELNRLHGIGAGDAVLRELALRMRLRIRSADALGRSGGDTFLAILPHSDEGAAATFADALRQRLARRPMAVGETEVRVTVSIGVAVMRPGEELDADGLMARAGEALDSARAGGGDRIALDRAHGLARLEERRSEPDDASEGESRDHEA